MTFSTHAAVVDRSGAEFTLRELEIGDLASDEVLVRIAGAGICHTDLIARDQVIPTPLPAVLGHEGSGTIVATGPAVTNLRKGDGVVLSYMSCGECRRCRAGEPAYCEHMPVLNFLGNRTDGSSAFKDTSVASHFFGQSSFATYAVANHRNAVKVESPLDLALLGPLGCGVQTGAGAVLNVLAPTGGFSLLVVGSGAVGLSAALAALSHGYTRVAVVDPLESRRAMALELGVHETFDSREDGLTKRLAKQPFENVLDTSGNSAGLQLAVAATAVRGHCVLVGSPSAPGQTFPLQFGIFAQKGVTLRGVVEGDADPHTFIPKLLKLQAEGRFPFEKLIRTYPFAKINDAIEDQKIGACVKPVLIMDSAGEPV